MLGVSVADRFWGKVYKTEDCWLWTGAINSRGYGHFAVAHQQIVAAHRFAYELVVGPIPDGLTLDHLCRTRQCVKPAHLEPVTNRVNILRGSSLSASRARTEVCSHGHQFTPENTIHRKRAQGGRSCRECQRLHNVAIAERRLLERRTLRALR